MFLRLLHSLGLTNLTDSEVDKYGTITSSEVIHPKKWIRRVIVSLDLAEELTFIWRFTVHMVIGVAMFSVISAAILGVHLCVGYVMEYIGDDFFVFVVLGWTLRFIEALLWFCNIALFAIFIVRTWFHFVKAILKSDTR